MGAIPLRIVEGADPLQVISGRDELTKPEQGVSHREVGLQEERRVLGPLSQAQELLPELLCRLELSPYTIKPPQPSQHGEELRALSHLRAQLACPGVCVFHLRGCKALSSHQRRA